MLKGEAVGDEVAGPDGARGSRLSFWLIIGIILAALVGGLLLVPFPGLQYDEMLFVPGATEGGLGSTSRHFVYRRVLGLPLQLMTYIGALKSWIYTPIFSVFGVSVESVRVPMVIVFCLAVAIAVALVWRYGRPWAAVAAALLLCTDPVFALMSRADWGPVALAGLLRVAAIYALLRALEGRRVVWLWAAVAALALGVFNKLDFAILTFALIVASGIVLHRQWRQLWQAARLSASGALALLAVTYFLAYRYMYARSGSVGDAAMPLLDQVETRLRLVADTFDGGTLLEFMTGRTISAGSLILAAAAAGIVVALIVAIATRRAAGSELGRSTGTALSSGTVLLLLCVTMAFALAGILVVRGISGFHHVVILWPLPALALCLAAAFVHERLGASTLAGRLAVGAIVMCMALALVSQLITSVAFVSALRDPSARTPTWTDASVEAARVISAAAQRTDGVDEVLVTDWGLGNQIAGLVRPRSAIVTIEGEPWPLLRADPPSEHFILILHGAGAESFEGGRAAGLQLIDECRSRGGASSTLMSDRHIEVYEVSCPGAEGQPA